MVPTVRLRLLPGSAEWLIRHPHRWQGTTFAYVNRQAGPFRMHPAVTVNKDNLWMKRKRIDKRKKEISLTFREESGTIGCRIALICDSNGDDI